MSRLAVAYIVIAMSCAAQQAPPVSPGNGAAAQQAAETAAQKAGDAQGAAEGAAKKAGDAQGAAEGARDSAGRTGQWPLRRVSKSPRRRRD
jgi:hypothetical protein